MLETLTGNSDAIEAAIQREKADHKRDKAKIAERYYDYEHDITINMIY